MVTGSISISTEQALPKASVNPGKVIGAPYATNAGTSDKGRSVSGLVFANARIHGEELAGTGTGQKRNPTPVAISSRSSQSIGTRPLMKCPRPRSDNRMTIQCLRINTRNVPWSCNCQRPPERWRHSGRYR